jgi:hypothetical protein
MHVRRKFASAPGLPRTPVLVQNGWSIRCRVRQAHTTEGRPHGLKYSFTLHDVDGTRLLGYDNGQGVAKKYEYDHRHPFRDTDEHVAYNFSDADTLLADFFASVRSACQTDGVAFEVVDEDMFEADMENDNENAE